MLAALARRGREKRNRERDRDEDRDVEVILGGEGTRPASRTIEGRPAEPVCDVESERAADRGDRADPQHIKRSGDRAGADDPLPAAAGPVTASLPQKPEQLTSPAPSLCSSAARRGGTQAWPGWSPCSP